MAVVSGLLTLLPRVAPLQCQASCCYAWRLKVSRSVPSSSKGWSTRLESFLSRLRLGPDARRLVHKLGPRIFYLSLFLDFWFVSIFLFRVVLKMEITPRGSQKYTQSSKQRWRQGRRDESKDREERAARETRTRRGRDRDSTRVHQVSGVTRAAKFDRRRLCLVLVH